VLYSYIRVRSDGFLLKAIVFMVREHEYMNIHPPPPHPQLSRLGMALIIACIVYILGSESKILLPFLRPECTAVKRPECIAVNRPQCFACMRLYKCSCFGVFCIHCKVCWFLACLYIIYTEFAYCKQFVTLGQRYFCVCLLRLILFSLFLHHLALSTI
jgi:hypothetical protein